MNQFFLKNLRFLSMLLVVPFVYLAAWLLPWREEDNEYEAALEARIETNDAIIAPVGKELVTQA